MTTNVDETLSRTDKISNSSRSGRERRRGKGAWLEGGETREVSEKSLGQGRKLPCHTQSTAPKVSR